MKNKYLTSPKKHITYDMRVKAITIKEQFFGFLGYLGAGKSTLAHAVEKQLFELGMQVIVLDGDIVRTGLCSDLSFSDAARNENIRRVAELSRILALQGTICICCFISPLKEQREITPKIINNFYHEIYISCSLKECEKRDIKGYYKLAK